MKPPHELAQDFADFCKAHPELRFWQALLAFTRMSGPFGYIYMSNILPSEAPKGFEDTFYWNNLNEL